jgi:hypothetical protein
LVVVPVTVVRIVNVEATVVVPLFFVAVYDVTVVRSVTLVIKVMVKRVVV